MSRTIRKNNTNNYRKPVGKKQSLRLGKIKKYCKRDKKVISNNEKLKTRKKYLSNNTTEYWYYSKYIGTYPTYEEFLKRHPKYR